LRSINPPGSATHQADKQLGITDGAAKNIGVVKIVEKELEISAAAMKLAPQSLPLWEPPSSHGTLCEIHPMPNDTQRLYSR